MFLASGPAHTKLLGKLLRVESQLFFLRSSARQSWGPWCQSHCLKGQSIAHSLGEILLQEKLSIKSIGISVMSGFAYQIILLVILWLSIGLPTEIGWHGSVISSWQWEALGPMSPILDVFWYIRWLGDLRIPFDFFGSKGCCLTASQKWWHLFFGRNWRRSLYMSFIFNCILM